MNAVFRALGALVLMLAALALSRGYSAYTRKRLSEGEELLLLLRHIRTGIAHSLTEPRAALASFRATSPALGALIGEAVETGDVRALGGRLGALSVPGEMKALLSGYFSALGRGYREEELSLADGAIAELSRILSTEREELPKSAATLRLLAVSLALGLTILLL